MTKVKKILEMFSPAVVNAMAKPIDTSKVKSVCPHCGYNLPTYPGRYPVKCPSCNNQIGSLKEENRRRAIELLKLFEDNSFLSKNEAYKIEDKIIEGIAKDGIGGSREKVYFKYIIDKNEFRPTGNIKTIESIPAGIYKVRKTYEKGLFFDLHQLKTDEILSFEDERYNQVLNEINEFWNLRENFHKMGFTHKRGMLLYGPPGTGKSCLLKLAMSESVDEGNIVLISDSIDLLHEGILKIKDIEPNRRLLAIAEDVEELREHSLLQILDGDDQMENFLFLTTTNYIERIPKRVLRPSRLDRKIEVLNPPAAGRKAYFTNKLEIRGIKDNIDELVRITNGFSFAQLREFMVSVYCLKQDKLKTAERIKKNFETSGVVSESFNEKTYTVKTMSKKDIETKRKDLMTKYYKGEIDKATYQKKDNELKAAMESDLKTRNKIRAKEFLKLFTEKDMCPASGCVKKVGDKWRVVSNKTGKLWPAEYDSEQDAKGAISAYHFQKSK